MDFVLCVYECELPGRKIVEGWWGVVEKNMGLTQNGTEHKKNKLGHNGAVVGDVREVNVHDLFIEFTVVCYYPRKGSSSEYLGKVIKMG